MRREFPGVVDGDQSRRRRAGRRRRREHGESVNESISARIPDKFRVNRCSALPLPGCYFVMVRAAERSMTACSRFLDSQSCLSFKTETLRIMRYMCGPPSLVPYIMVGLVSVFAARASQCGSPFCTKLPLRCPSTGSEVAWSMFDDCPECPFPKVQKASFAYFQCLWVSCMLIFLRRERHLAAVRKIQACLEGWGVDSPPSVVAAVHR